MDCDNIGREPAVYLPLCHEMGKKKLFNKNKHNTHVISIVDFTAALGRTEHHTPHRRESRTADGVQL